MKTRIAVLVAVAAAVAGCSGGSPGETTANQPATPVTATTPAPGGTGSSTQSASPKPSKSKRPKVPVCSTGQLQLSIGKAGAAAGKFYQRVILTNTGSAPCTMFGRPGVSFVDSSGNQLGASAGNDPGAALTVTLAPGGSAYAQLRETDTGVYSRSVCRPEKASQLKVYPPNQTTALLAPDRVTVCTTSAGRSGVTPVRSGTGE